MMRSALVALMLAGAICSAGANEAANLAADPVLEARVMKVAEELRCLVCQNETIAASHADLAVDLRKQIRSKLSQGQSEQQIDRKSTRLNSSHSTLSRMPSSA